MGGTHVDVQVQEVALKLGGLSLQLAADDGVGLIADGEAYDGVAQGLGIRQPRLPDGCPALAELAVNAFCSRLQH